jgi:hypothetical protein
MTATTVVTQGPSATDDFGLDAIAQHNAVATSTETFPAYQSEAKGLGIDYSHEGYTPYDDASLPYTTRNNLPTPRSTTATSEGFRTRSGRSTRGRTDSPFSNARVSKSPAARSTTSKKSKLDRSKTPKLTAPLSVLTKDLSVPLKDMDEWVHRSAETRQAEVTKRNGYVTRPMNSFMLYRSCYAERTKAWCVQNNHQVVSSVSGESWPMEPAEVRQQFEEWARIERENHAKAHPEYKFSPSKSTKRRKGEMSDDDAEVDGSDLDADPDGEYRAGGGRLTRLRKAQQQAAAQYVEMMPMNSTFGFDSHPYFGAQQQQHQQQLPTGYEQSQYHFQNPGRPIPSNVVYDANGLMYDPQTGAYLQTATYQNPHYGYVQDVVGVRVPTPQEQQQLAQQQAVQQSVGGYGLPTSGQRVVTADELFASSRSATPAIYQYTTSAFAQPIYPHYTTATPVASTDQSAYMPPTTYTPQPSIQQALAEHQAHLLAAAQPQQAIDPSLDADFGKDGHFECAMAPGDFSGLEYFQPPESVTTSPVNGGQQQGWISGEVV